MKFLVLQVIGFITIQQGLTLKCPTCTGTGCNQNDIKEVLCNDRKIPKFIVKDKTITILSTDYGCVELEYKTEDGSEEKMKHCVLLEEGVDYCNSLSTKFILKKCIVTKQNRQRIESGIDKKTNFKFYDDEETITTSNSPSGAPPSKKTTPNKNSSTTNKPTPSESSPTIKSTTKNPAPTKSASTSKATETTTIESNTTSSVKPSTPSSTTKASTTKTSTTKKPNGAISSFNVSLFTFIAILALNLVHRSI